MSTGTPATILVVDDESIVRETCGCMLEGLGFLIATARDGREAVEVLERQLAVISAVVLDLTMPVMNGEDAFHAMRALRADLPVLLTSGYYPQDVATRFAGQSRLAFLKKPYSMAELEQAMQGLLA